MLLSSLVATQVSPPEDRQSFLRPRSEKSTCDLNFAFCHHSRKPQRDNVFSLPYVHIFTRDSHCQRLSAAKKRCADPRLRMKNPDAIVVSIVATTGIREALFSLRLFIVFNKKVLAFRDISSVETFIPQRTRKLLAVYSFFISFFFNVRRVCVHEE